MKFSIYSLVKKSIMEFAFNDLGEAAENEEDFNQLNDETFGDIDHCDDFSYEYDVSEQDYEAIFSNDFEEKIKSNLNHLVLDDEDHLQKTDRSVPLNIRTSMWSNNMLPGLDIWGSPAEDNYLSFYKADVAAFSSHQNIATTKINDHPAKSIMTLEELENQLLGHSTKPAKVSESQTCPDLILDSNGLTVEEIERLFLSNSRGDEEEGRRVMINGALNHNGVRIPSNLNGAMYVQNNNVPIRNLNFKLTGDLYNQLGVERHNIPFINRPGVGQPNMPFNNKRMMMGNRPPGLIPMPPHLQHFANLPNNFGQIPSNSLQEAMCQRMLAQRFMHNGNQQPNFHSQQPNMNIFTHPNLYRSSPHNPNYQSAYSANQISTNQRHLGHDYYEWNNENSTDNHGDEYAGLMTDTEKNWIIKIQLMQLHTDNPHIDDFYYTNYMLKKKLLLLEVEGNENVEVIMPQLSRPENKPYEPIRYEGALGRLTASSLNKPRQIIDVLVPINQDEAPRPDVKKLKLSLMKIEKKYDMLLNIEDLEKQAAGLPLEQKQEVLNERFSKLNNLIGEIIDIDEEFAAILNIRKGLLLACRLLPLAQKPKNIEFLLKLIGKLVNICKKEKSTDCDSALIPLLCVHG